MKFYLQHRQAITRSPHDHELYPIEDWREAQVAAGRTLEADPDSVQALVLEFGVGFLDIGYFVGYRRETREPMEFLLNTEQL